MVRIKVKEHFWIRRIAWSLFFFYLIFQIGNFAVNLQKNITYRSIPFQVREDRAVSFSDSVLAGILSGKVILSIDSLVYAAETERDEEAESDFGNRLQFQFGGEENRYIVEIEEFLNFADKNEVEVTYRDSLGKEVSTLTVETVPRIDYSILLNSIINLIIILFVLFNSYLLLRYSLVRENMLIVIFLVLLFYIKINYILPEVVNDFIAMVITPFWGIVFYHFVLIKTELKKNVQKTYLISTVIFLFFYFLSFLEIDISGISQVWSLFWLIKGLLLLREQYKLTGSMDLKRLIAAFWGIGFSLICAAVFIGVVFLIGLLFGITSLVGLSEMLGIDSFLNGILVAVLVVLPLLGIFFGILWFLGSFSWSLLTGTVLDVKIRSTLIYSIVGVFFITVFGLVDYSLGEFLQHLFGKFMGSEFIAGIPATIGVIAFFNPIKNRIERIVDSRLNSSELDFLEKTETFSRNLSDEGVLEGFEEYICENLYNRLSVRKVALISFDSDLKGYKYNEVRGSDIVENSRVEDENGVLNEPGIIRISKSGLCGEQDICSFSLILPVLSEEKEKWFLALGKRNDASSYTRKDEAALVSLTERIRLSLKFILAYEELMSDKYEKELQKRDHLILELRKTVSGLKKQLVQLKGSET